MGTKKPSLAVVPEGAFFVGLGFEFAPDGIEDR